MSHLAWDESQSLDSKKKKKSYAILIGTKPLKIEYWEKKQQIKAAIKTIGNEKTCTWREHRT